MRKKKKANYIGKLLTDLEFMKCRCILLPRFLCLPPAPFLIPSFKVIFSRHNSEPTPEDKTANKIDMVPILKWCITTERRVLWGKRWCTLGEKNRDPNCVKEIFPEMRPRKKFFHLSTPEIWIQISLWCECCPAYCRRFCSLPGQYLFSSWGYNPLHMHTHIWEPLTSSVNK